MANKRMLDKLFISIIKHLEDSLWFVEWLSNKPTGQFTIQVNLGQGSVRGRPKISITEGG